MTLAELEQLLDQVGAQAQEIYQRDGSHTPLALVVWGGAVVPVAVMLRGESDKDAVRQVFERAVQAGVDAVVWIMEGWAVAGDRATAEAVLAWKQQGRSLKDFPGRTEALIVEGACRAGYGQRRFNVTRMAGMAGEVLVVAAWPARPDEVARSRFLSDLPWPEPGGNPRAIPGHEHCPGCVNCGRGQSDR